MKNKEDYPHQAWLLPPDERGPIEAIYANGRQDAIDIKNWFWRLDNADAHPTLKSFVDVVIPALELKLEQAITTLDDAKKAHTTNGGKYWSVGAMIELTQKQINLTRSSIQTVQLLKYSNLYREENGEQIMNEDKSIVINTNSYNTNSNINSPNASVDARIATNSHEELAPSTRLARNVVKIVVGIIVAVIAAVIIKHWGLQ